MSNSIELSGFDELEDLLHDMTVSDADEKKAMKKAIEPIHREIESNSPEKTSKLKREIKDTVKKEDFATVGEVKLGAWYSPFQNWGTSQQKAHVGFFDRAVNKSKDEALRILAEELLK